MKHFFAIFLIFFLAVTVVQADEAISDDPPETGNSEQTELPRLLIHSNTFNALKFQFADGVQVPPGQLSSLLNIPENKQLLSKAVKYTVATRILQALTIVSVAGIVVYAGVDDLPHADAMLGASLGAGMGSAVAGLLTGQAAGINYLRAVDNYNLSILGIPIGQTKKN